jgi:hypothetical protein
MIAKTPKKLACPRSRMPEGLGTPHGCASYVSVG